MLSRGYDHFNSPVWFLPFLQDDRPQVRPLPFLNTDLRVRDLLTFHYSRCLHGALKGNIGVVKSAMAELTDETNVARGFSLLLMAWSVGYVIGSGILPIVLCLR
jgi:hypothetical protein